ncbi:MAG: hypothetical protein QME51_11335, partial [Planctomycetota bacterium]|nr:hypothetical protein [Planctomycetota bacterium]
KHLYGKKMICHFYIKDSSHQYYDNADFVYFNLLSKTRGWIIKGTPEHGISSKRKKRSQIPCLNCFEVDEKLYNGLKTLLKNGNKKFEFALLLIRRKVDHKYKVINVSIKRPKKTEIVPNLVES